MLKGRCHHGSPAQDDGGRGWSSTDDKFTFNEAISFQIHCNDQDEVDYYWSKLSEGGEEVACGWLKDRYGLSWQVTPTVLIDMISDPDPEKGKRTTEAMLAMTKFDIAALQKAHAGE